jgi:patatin-like phospholipase/acyl hydrolase
MDRTVTTRDPAFRVLALDGGGMRGIFTASFLSTLEDLSGRRIGEHFDLVVGCSTGGIIGLAVAFGIPARRILDLYVERGARIFGRSCRLGMILRPKYTNTALTRSLRELFGERAIDDCLTPVCIPSYELTSSYPRIWKDEHAEDLPWWGGQPAWLIALATAAAPLYFPAVQVFPGDSHVDGGLFANNPVLIGLTEAVRAFNQPLGRIRILSIGAGERAERIPFERARRMGLWQWKASIYEHMLISQARSAHEIAQRLLAPEQYLRVNLPLEHAYPLDDHEAARTLLEPGAQQARVRYPDLEARFLYAPATLGRAQKAAVAAAARPARATGRRPA